MPRPLKLGEFLNVCVCSQRVVPAPNALTCRTGVCTTDMLLGGPGLGLPSSLGALWPSGL